MRARDRRRAPGGGARPADDRARADPAPGDAARAPARRGAPPRRARCSSGSAWSAPPTGRSAPTRGGMRRRLDLASALVHEPRVLFLDEPTTGLDPVSRKSIWEEVEKLNREGTTVFLTTQYLEEADNLADRVGIIDDGRIVAEGTPAALKAEIGRPHLEVKLADGHDGAAPRRSCAGSASRFPRKDGAALVELEGGPRASRPSSARSTRPGSRRVARPRRADAGRRLRRQDRLPPGGRDTGEPEAAEPEPDADRRTAPTNAAGDRARSACARSSRRSAGRS